VQVAWDPRIQRKVAVKTIRLTALDAARASLPGAQAVSAGADAEAVRDALPWEDYADESFPEIPELAYPFDPVDDDYEDAGAQDQVTSLSHVPGLDEARTAAMLSDPRIVTVYDFEIRGREAFLIMEYVEGITLTSLLSDYSNYLTLDMVAAVFDSVAAALVTAHGAGVLHLDIKPDNILINTQGQVKVTDFGLATLADASGAGKTGGGTIGYMPPEQIRREKLDARSDEWSLASVTYEMLTGSNPFRVKGLDAALQAIEEAELVLPSLCWKDIDEQIDDVVFYALDPDRDERYASVLDFAEEAEKFLGDPEKGTAQLELVVEDALGLGEWSDDEDMPVVPDIEASEVDAHAARGRRTGRSSASSGVAQGFMATIGEKLGLGSASQAALPSADSSHQDRTSQRSFTERFLDLVVDQDDTAATGNLDGYLDEGRSRSDAREARTHVPIAERASSRTVQLASHALGALGSGFLAALATSNMQPITSAFGSGAMYVIGFFTIVAAVLGAIRSHIGALVSLCMVGVAFVMCGHPIVGAFVLIVTVAWWYTIGHEGSASANVVLLLPMLGSIGASTMVPFFSGASLPPLRACATTFVAFVFAVILSGLGSASILDWGALAHWDFVRPDVSGIILRVLSRPDTWAIALGWMVATASLSLLRLRGSKALDVIAVACALVAVLVGTLVFCPPSPQLLVSAIIACVALLAVEL
jgi:serine/threonine protein kinase